MGKSAIYKRYSLNNSLAKICNLSRAFWSSNNPIALLKETSQYILTQTAIGHTKLIASDIAHTHFDNVPECFAVLSSRE